MVLDPPPRWAASALDIIAEILDVRYGETRRRVMRSPRYRQMCEMVLYGCAAMPKPK